MQKGAAPYRWKILTRRKKKAKNPARKQKLHSRSKLPTVNSTIAFTLLSIPPNDQVVT
jgi:hypothetical protein